jgi:hypothetical protein
MTTFDLALGAVAALGAVQSLLLLVGLARVARCVPVLSATAAPPPERWPRVSVIVPARDEARDVEAALRSRLRDDYPDLELVIVDDRSTDGTSAIVDRLAAEEARLRAVHVTALPPGWLGKVYALERGARAASGELLLFSDADVHVAPGAMRRAVAWMEAERLGHLGVFPGLWPTRPLVEATLLSFFRVIWVAARPWSIPDPRSRAAFGVGAFNLVRRGALEASPGFAHLRMEQADDAALGQMLKRSGARCGVANGRGDVQLHFYRSLAELRGGMEKSGARWPLPAVLLSVALLLVLELGPWVALTGGATARAAGVAGVALSLLSTAVTARWMRHRLLPALLAPAGVVIFAWATLRAAALAFARGGVFWRGTFYGTAELREGSRFQP